jgi:DNA-binding NarL/FixJ family response regulator
MSKIVLLVGHCGPDSSYLRMIVKKADPEVSIVAADDSRELTRALETSEPALVLFNRELGYGFEPATGVETIEVLRRSYPNLKMILVSNYAEAQQAAVAAGALPGFGKRELGTPRVLAVLREALGSGVGASPL